MRTFLYYIASALLTLTTPALANVTVSSPANGSTVSSPVHYVATATTTTCSKGVASMGVYIDNHLTYVSNGTSLNTSLSLNPGSYHTVVEEWDYCGGATYTPIGITVSGGTSPTTGVQVSSPANNSTVTSPVNYVATASTTTCSKGVASMGVYVNNHLTFVSNGASLNTQISLSAGYRHTVVEEWDYCGGALYTAVNVTVGTSSLPTITLTANPLSITAGSSSTLTATATNATKVTISGTDGSSYALPSSGGTQAVTPAATTTYTAEATGASGNASASETVTVGSQNGLQAVAHVVFMLQENHTFDNYFGMLNPYRESNGWNIGADGNTYNVDGIDDKLATISNEDDQGQSYSLFKFKSTCIDDATSDWLASYGDVDRYDFLATRSVAMDGFVHNAEGYARSCASGGGCSGTFTDLTGERAMGYYDQGFLNYYYYMASQFALSDRWFSPLSSKSIDNRIATFTGGTTQGLVFDPGNDDHLGQLVIPTIFEELDQASVSWKIYYTVTQGLCFPGAPCSGSVYPATDFSALNYSYKYLYENPTHAVCTAPTQASSAVGDSTNSFCIDPSHIAPLSQYFSDLTNGALPSFAFIEAGYGNNDEHPGSGQPMIFGQAQVAKVVNAFMASPEWKDSIFFLSYDEGGGPYDHVPPVPGSSNKNTDASLGSIPDISQIAVNADSYKPCLPSGGTPTLHCDLRSGDPGVDSGDAAAEQGFAAQLGFRVPNMIVSPFTRKHYVSHTPMDHTAVIKFVENRFIGPNAHLTARDAAQSNLLEFFDFTGVPWATPPTPPSPVTPQSLGYNSCTPTSMGP
ncbi:MAG: alkaline phosphatase family protein [Acidobacteriaceae bacterium]